jgi:hypothetical protein
MWVGTSSAGGREIVCGRHGGFELRKWLDRMLHVVELHLGLDHNPLVLQLEDQQTYSQSSIFMPKPRWSLSEHVCLDINFLEHNRQEVAGRGR